MALCPLITVNRLLNCHTLRLCLYLARRNTSKSTPKRFNQNDFVADVFNENLHQEKSNKFREFIFKLTLPSLSSSNHHQLKSESGHSNDAFAKSLKSATNEEIISIIFDFIRENDLNKVLYALEISKEKTLDLPSEFMMYLIRLFAKLGHTKGFHFMLNYYKNSFSSDYNKNCEFKCYDAELLWNTGKMEEALNILKDFYEQKLLKHEVNSVVHDIIKSAVTKQGEASLVLITDFVTKLANTYNIYYPKAVLWKFLYASEWFADQKLALELLKNDNKLLKIISPLIPLWCVHFLQFHNVVLVERFSEVLLQNKLIDHYSPVLHMLFDYYYSNCNLKRCSGIIKFSIESQIPLEESYQKRFIILLTTGKPEKIKTKLPKRIEYQINLKF